MGLLVAVIVHSANSQDRDGAGAVVTYIAAWRPRVHSVVADGGDAGTLVHWVAATVGWTLQVINRTADMVGVEVVPTRWVGERTVAWLGADRRWRTDSEGRTEVSDAFVSGAMVHLMLRRFDPSEGL